jgi:hypothetical protein
MCWLSTKVTVGIWPEDDCIDWLITLGVSEGRGSDGCWAVPPWAAELPVALADESVSAA